MPRKAQTFAVGERVRYASAFLRSTGMLTGAVPFARGSITALEPFGVSMLATIRWNSPDIPERVITANLERCR
jgi:hypothetical protein